MEVLRCVQTLLDRRRAACDPTYVFTLNTEPRVLEKNEMIELMSNWKAEYEQRENQQDLIKRDTEIDLVSTGRPKKKHKARHGRFSLHVRRTYGSFYFVVIVSRGLILNPATKFINFCLPSIH